MIKRKVFIVDDHSVVRQGLINFINSEPDFIVCGESDNANDAIVRIGVAIPDIAILDISLNNSSGIELAKAVKSRFDIPILMLSMHDEALYAERALRAGAMGYIMKNKTMDEIVAAMREVAERNIYLNPRIKDMIIKKLLSSPNPGHENPLNSLTNRELEVFRKIGEGLAGKIIAREMGLGIKTVETYRERIKKKLNLKNSTELVKYAITWKSEIDNS